MAKEKSSSFKIKTKSLQDLLSKVMKGIVNNQFIEMSSLLGVALEGNDFHISAYDKSHYIRVFDTEKYTSDEFNVTIKADKFNKLVQKTTTENITLTINSDFLTFKGNGTYKLELSTDEDNEPIKFPDIPAVKGEEKETKLSFIQSIIDVNKPALGSASESQKYLTGYYCSDNVVTSDNKIIAVRNLKLFDEPFLAAPEAFTLLSTMDSEDVTYVRQNGKGNTPTRILFETKNVIVVTSELNVNDPYPYDDIMGFAETDEFKHSCKVSKKDLLNVLDRLSLFVDANNDNLVALNFTKDGIICESLEMTGSELLEYIDSKNTADKFEEFSCKVNVNNLKSAITPQKEDKIVFEYGSGQALKINSLGSTYLIALGADNSDEDYVEVSTEETEEDKIPY